MSRFRDAETLARTVREGLPGAAVSWLVAVREEMEKLTMAALTGGIGDEEFRAMVEETSRRLPGLMDTMDHEAIGELMEHGMGAAMANGISRRLQTQDRKTQEKKAKLPWETDAYRASRNYRRDKDGKFSQTEGQGGNRDETAAVKIHEPTWEGTKTGMKARAMEAMKKIKSPLQHPAARVEMAMNGEARKKSLIQAKSPEEFMAAANLAKIFLYSRANPPAPDTKSRPDVKAFHTFDAAVKIAGKVRPVRITAIERPGDGTLHFKLIHIRKEKGT